MNIHNQMQDVVSDLVAEIFDDTASSAPAKFCTCPQCRLDVTCYVLNRVRPRYVVSERGVAHTEAEYIHRVQEAADIVTLIREAIERVSTTKRPHFPHDDADTAVPATGAMHNFPMVKGRIFNGKTFEPVYGIEVILLADGDMVEMVDPNWQNPCRIYESGAGSFFFMPAPTPAQEAGESKSFSFEIRVDDQRFEPLHHFFAVTSVSSQRYRYALHTSESHTTEDLYLFEKE